MANKKLTVKDIVITALLAAICFVATYIHIPFGKAMIHLGTTAIFISAMLFGGVKGGLAGGIGLGLFDLLGGYVAYAPWTLLTKGLTGLVCGLISFAGRKNGGFGRQSAFDILGCLAGGVISLAGYIAADCVIYDMGVAYINAIASLTTTGIGIVIALPLGIALKQAFKKAHIL